MKAEDESRLLELQRLKKYEAELQAQAQALVRAKEKHRTVYNLLKSRNR